MLHTIDYFSSNKNKIVSYSTSFSSDSVKHPHECFKPDETIDFEVYDDIPIANLRCYVRAGLNDGTLALGPAIQFVYQKLKVENVKAPKDFKSGDRVIIKSGTDYGIFSIFNVKKGPNTFMDLADERKEDDDSSDYALLMRILVTYRMGRARLQNYKKLIYDKADKMVGSVCPGTKMPGSYSYSFDNWMASTSFTKLVAAVDWFYCTNFELSNATLRLATLTSRFRDCAVLCNLEKIIRASGISLSHFPRWIWDKQVSLNFDQIADGGSSMYQVGSLEPYFIDLRLARGSPYSVARNPDLNAFMNALGVLIGYAPSSKAAAPEGVPYLRLYQLALITAYCTASNQSFHPMFGKDAEQYKQATAGQGNKIITLGTPLAGPSQPTAEKEDSDKIPFTDEPFVIFNFFKKRDFQTTPAMEEFGKQKLKTLKEVRANTIGDKLYCMIIGEQVPMSMRDKPIDTVDSVAALGTRF